MSESGHLGEESGSLFAAVCGLWRMYSCLCLQYGGVQSVSLPASARPLMPWTDAGWQGAVGLEVQSVAGAAS